MQFSGADILVIGIVLVVLLVYRQLDRSNRSLEKVKKYAARVHDELEVHVQEKVTAIKDIGIEVEVHQKAAREVLKRVQAIEAGLNERSSEVENIGARIREYDGALEELVNMTARAEENIGRVRDESAYVDNVGKRIKESQQRISDVERSVETLVDQFAAANQRQLQQIRQTVSSDAQQKADEMGEQVEAFGERLNEYAEYARGIEEHAEAISDRTKAELEDIAETVVHRAQEASIQGSEQLSELREQMESIQADYERKLLSLAERGESMETAALAKLREQIEAQGRGLQAELADRIDGSRKVLSERIAGFERDIAESQSILAERSTKLAAERDEVLGQIARFGDELRGQIDSASEKIQASVLGGIEARLAEYESQIGYRLEKLDGVGGDLDQLEARLNDSMRVITEKVNAEFTDFAQDFARSREEQRKAVDKELGTLREQMGELETGIVDLKNQAYENVGEKLQVFEDEFFADLKERQVAMEQKIVDWQAAFQAELETVVSEAREERTAVESTYTEEVRIRLGELQSAEYGRFEKIQEEAVAFQQSIELRVGRAQEQIAAIERDLEEETARLAADSRAELREQFAKHRDQVGDEVVDLERGLRKKLEDLTEVFETGRSELESTLAESRSEAVNWKAQVDARLSGASAEVNQQIADFRVKMGDTIAELKDVFAADREEALAASAEERERLQIELDSLSAQVLGLADEIRDKSAAALGEFGEMYEQLRSDAVHNTTSLGADVDTRVRDFRVFVQDTRDQFSAMQERLLGKLQEETQSLAGNLEEIEKRQRSFAEQTRIFERADSLKDELHRAIAGLKEDLARVEQQRKDIREIEGQFARLKKSTDDVTERMARFMAEKRRIDTLEDDYKRLMSLSQAVELKLDHVTASNDSLQAMQASLRGLEELEKDVEGKFQRLEKKKAILDLTTEGVDRNFQHLQEAEKRLGEISTELSTLPARVEELSNRLGQLSSNRRDADAAVKQLALLDQTLEEIEERMESLNAAREWLARTETRLGEVQTEAEEQVKLLGAIMKQQNKGKPSGGGAPAVTTRDTVLKLARQSWNVDEIARATGLSRGEVELILELATK